MKVLISGSGRDQSAFSVLEEAGYEIISPPVIGERGGRVSDEDLVALAAEADLSLMPLPRGVMAAAPKLRAIVQASIGVERIDVPSATEHGILVCNSPAPANFNGVAEATVGLLVALSKRLKRKEASLRDTGWGTESDRGVLLMGRTLGIVGFGRIGSGVARRLQNWGIRIVACDPYIAAEKATALDVELMDLDRLLQESDFVTLHLVVTPETTKMIGERELRLMKPTAYLVNTSRGQVIDEDALCRALDEEWIAGAALDVFDPEPLSRESPLRDLDKERVILTPHSASHTWESREGNVEYAIASTLAILRGEIPDTVVNPEVIPLWEKRFGEVKEITGS